MELSIDDILVITGGAGLSFGLIAAIIFTFMQTGDEGIEELGQDRVRSGAIETPARLVMRFCWKIACGLYAISIAIWAVSSFLPDWKFEI